MSIEAMKQALEALEWNLPFIEDYGNKGDVNIQFRAITSLRQAIAEAEKQKPVVHQNWCASLTQLLLSHPPKPAPCNCRPPKREWVGLTEKEILECRSANHLYFYKAIEDKLKEKNDG